MNCEFQNYGDVDLLEHGGKEAVPQLVARYRDKLLRMITFRLDRRLLGKVDAEDVLQDVLIEVVRRLDRYRQQPSVPVFVWLRQIANQVLIDLHRRYLGAQMRDVAQETSLFSVSAADASCDFLAAQLAGNLTSPSQCFVRKEAVAAVRVALEQLGPIDREVLVLRHLEELSNNEVAEVLEIDRFAASKRYLRALGRLRKVMPASKE
jgi:RNA polymerase sigma-70 factor, ECF subfamily